MFFDFQIYKKAFLVTQRIWGHALVYQLCTKGVTFLFLSFVTGILYTLWGTSGTSNYELLSSLFHWKSLIIVPFFGFLFFLVFLFEHSGLLILSVAGYKGERLSLLRVWKESLRCILPLLKVTFVKGLFLLGALVFWGWFIWGTQRFIYDPFWLAFVWGIGGFVGLLGIFRIYIQWLFTSYTICIEHVFNLSEVLRTPTEMKKEVLQSLSWYVIVFYSILVLLNVGVTALLFLCLQGVIWLGVALVYVSTIVGFIGVFVLFLLFLLPLLLPVLYHGFHTALYYSFVTPIRLRPKKNQRKEYSFSWKWFCSLFLIIYLAGGSLLTYGVHHQIQQLDKEILIMAHRGDSIRGVQNTFSAFESTYRSGIKYIELDVQQTQDGILVAFHDEDTYALTGQSGTIAERTWEEVQQLRVEEKESIPSLDSIIQWAQQHALVLFLDIKELDPEQQIGKQVARLIQKYNAQDIVSVMSLHTSVLEQVKKTDLNIKRGFVIAAKAGEWNQYEVDFYTMNMFWANRKNISQAHALGKPVYVWQIDGDISEGEVLFVSADGIIVDDPVRSMAWFEAYQEWSLSRKISYRLEMWFKQLRW